RWRRWRLRVLEQRQRSRRYGRKWRDHCLGVPVVEHGPGIVGVATGELCRYSLVIPCLIGLDLPRGTAFLHGTAGSAARNYNDFGKELRKRPEVEWLCLIEDDHVVPRDAIMRLLAHDKSVVSALYLKRNYPFEPVIYQDVAEDGLLTPRR